ncbi:MAG: acyl-CoA dehydrogenase family protein [Pseudomonadota bacterium]
MGDVARTDAYGSLDFSETQADLLESASRFCADYSPSEKVRAQMTGETGFDPAVWAAIVDMGWLGIAIPDAYDGGIGLSPADLVPVMEQMGKHLLATPFMASVTAAHLITLAGTETQKAKLLPAIARGEYVSLATMETDGAWEPLTATASIVEDAGNMRLSGEKVLVPYGGLAQFILVLIERARSPAFVILSGEDIPKTAKRAETLIDETQRSVTLALDGLSCAPEQLIDGDHVAGALRRAYHLQALLASAAGVGAAQAVIDYTADYLRTRKQFGKPIGAYQALKHPMVDAYVSTEQARSHLYSAAASIDQQGTGEIAVRMARAAADQALSFAADRSIQFHGGFGFTYDCDAQLYRRFAAWQAAMFGDAAYHRARLAPLLFG